MVRKRLDDRVRALLERSVATGQRSMLVLVGDHGKDQVPNLHAILSKCTVQSRPKVLWCYKKELGFSTHRKKRMKKLKRDKARGLQPSETDQMDNFELFISQTDISWCYYKDSHRVLGTTVGLLVLQDFEALTPNLMARTIETVQGGGLIVFLLRTVNSLKQLYHITMDVHARYRTESSQAVDLVPRFNERFILSLADATNCLVCDDELNVLPVSRRTLRGLTKPPTPPPSSSSSAGLIAGSATMTSAAITPTRGEAGEVIVPVSEEEQALRDLKESLADTPHVGVLVDLTKTLDQAQALLVFLEACSEKAAKCTVAMTAARGRGKSAAIGLCLAGAVALGYSTIAVTAPEPENLVAVFDFCVRGLHALQYQEHLDYTVTYNRAVAGREDTKCIVSIQIHSRGHRQLVQYIPPSSSDQFVSAEIVAIDEAAAIPLPVVKALLRTDRLAFLSSTVNGYEGTGRALSLKLIKELREAKGQAARRMAAAAAAADGITGPSSASSTTKGQAKVHEQRWAAAAAALAAATSSENREKDSSAPLGPLREIELSTPIRYAQGDPVEAWLNKLLCLDCASSAAAWKLQGGAPSPGDCELYHVDRDALFSYHKLSENFLQKIMGLYTSAHYKNTPNDLQMLSDAPAHSIYVLLSPSAERDSQALPDVLAVVQVALEGRISRKTVEAQLARGHRSAGDLIPWTLAQQFGDSKFAQLNGGRVVRIAVHPSVQGMGYGSRAIEQLYRFYNGDLMGLAEAGDQDDDEVPDDDDTNSNQSGENKEDDDNSFEDDQGDRNDSDGIRAETLKPRKELPPLLSPLSDMEAPKLDWFGTSFGLTLPLHHFWATAGMRLLYLRQTRNELTGEHSAIMVRALPKRTGFDDTWLWAFMSDTRRRFISLLAGPFRDMDVRLAMSILDSMGDTTSGGRKQPIEVLDRAGGSTSEKISAEELDYYLTPHDLKRLELYGRNLCDHHLITDLLPGLARLYFTGRFGTDFSLSNVQTALLCGIGLQNRSVDSLTTELALPANQTLAMFNKAVRKLSMALNAVVMKKEKESMLTSAERTKAEAISENMRDVTQKTLEEDVQDGADEVLESITANQYIGSLPSEISEDRELMSYVVKGSDEQWKKALEQRDPAVTTGTVQIHASRAKRRALTDNDIENEGTKDKAALNKKSRKSTKTKSRH